MSGCQGQCFTEVSGRLDDAATRAAAARAGGMDQHRGCTRTARCLHSHIREFRGYLAPAMRPPTFLTPQSVQGGAATHQVPFIYKVKRHQDGTIDNNREKFKGRAVIAG